MSQRTEIVMTAPSEAREDVISIRSGDGAATLELMPIGNGVARGFLRFSPRGMRLSVTAARELSDALHRRGFSKILVGDSKKTLLKRALAPLGWRVEKAIPTDTGRRCTPATVFDIPLDGNLVDLNGAKVEMAGAGQMSGIRVDFDGRRGWAFYAEEETVARVISEPGRKQGFLAVQSAEDMFEVADLLVRHLAAQGKTIAVFTLDYGRFIRKFEPVMMWRMGLDSPKGYDHSAKPLDSSNKSMATRLFAEYYDESTVQAMLRLRKYRTDKNYSTFLVDGGFVITRLEGDVGLVYDIYVTPSKQGSGLGEELMRCALTSLSGRVSSVYLHTSYPRAKRMYEKFGFAVTYSQLGIWLYETSLTPPTAK